MQLGRPCGSKGLSLLEHSQYKASFADTVYEDVNERSSFDCIPLVKSAPVAKMGKPDWILTLANGRFGSGCHQFK